MIATPGTTEKLPPGAGLVSRRSNLDKSGMVIVRKGVVVSCADGFRFRVQRVRVGVFVGCLVDVYGREHRHVTRVEYCGAVRVVVK